MKNCFLFLMLITLFIFEVKGQEISSNAIGLRLGDNNGFGGEVSYQRALTKNNRLEFDLGWRNNKNVDAIKLAGLYQWVWNIDGGFNWYAGAGGGLGAWRYDTNGIDDNGTILFASGIVGIEYLFDIPIQLSLDFRPELYFNPDGYRDDNFGPDIGLGIRYRF